VYGTGIIGTFTKVLEEEGVNAFFNGWEPIFVGFFLRGEGILPDGVLLLDYLSCHVAIRDWRLPRYILVGNIDDRGEWGVSSPSFPHALKVLNIFLFNEQCTCVLTIPASSSASS
jgi:hypothetical protein